MASIKKARVNVGADTASDKALTDRAEAVGTMAILTALYATNAAFKAAIDEYVASGLSFLAAESKVNKLEATLTQARSDRDAARVTCKALHGTAVKQVEANSVTEADVQAYGFVYLDIVKLGLTPPSAIQASQDPKTQLLQIHVKYAGFGRARRVIIEISPDPVTATSFHRIDGDGVKRALAGYAPGTYWIHAATASADGRSDWFGPIAVVVK
jgi:hypothetical protein